NFNRKDFRLGSIMIIRDQIQEIIVVIVMIEIADEAKLMSIMSILNGQPEFFAMSTRYDRDGFDHAITEGVFMPGDHFVLFFISNAYQLPGIRYDPDDINRYAVT